jgi:hypothetical protein
VAAGVERAGVFGPPARSKDGGGAAHHIPLALECLYLLRWLVGGAGVGSDQGKPLAAGGGHDVDGTAGVLLLPEGDVKVCSLSLPNLPVSGENLNTLGGGAPASFPS